MPEIFGFKVEAPRLPSWNEVRSTVTHTAQTATQLGRSALSHARNLGSQGVDLGRRAIADPEGTVRRLAASARTGIHHAETAAQNGIRDGVMWTGRQIHAGANVARGAVRGNSTVAQAARGLITHAENNARFTVGVAGGLGKEAVGLVGAAGTLGTYATELQYSRSARAEFGNAISSGVSRGSVAVADYARSVAANPSRVAGDVRGAATATWNAGSGFVEGQVRRHEEAFRRGEGFETIGMTTGQVASYFIPVGAGAKAASTGVRGAEAIAVGGAREIASTGARQVLNPHTIKGWERAEAVYTSIRSQVGDIASIARNSGMSEAQVGRVRDHLFFKEHRLDDGLRRFDADPSIANAWARLQQGDHVASDIALLKHELFESRFEGIFKTDYRTAHNATLRSGRTWTGE